MVVDYRTYTISLPAPIVRGYTLYHPYKRTTDQPFHIGPIISLSFLFYVHHFRSNILEPMKSILNNLVNKPSWTLFRISAISFALIVTLHFLLGITYNMFYTDKEKERCLHCMDNEKLSGRRPNRTQLKMLFRNHELLCNDSCPYLYENTLGIFSLVLLALPIILFILSFMTMVARGITVSPQLCLISLLSFYLYVFFWIGLLRTSTKANEMTKSKSVYHYEEEGN